MRVSDAYPAFQYQDMRCFLPSKSPTWGAAALCALAALGLFMSFEVLALDGPDSSQSIFQPPISSQPPVAEAEGIVRNGAFAVREPPGSLHSLTSLDQPSSVVSGGPYAADGHLRRRYTFIRLPAHIRRASCSPRAPPDEPLSSPSRAS